jgi:restriction system protein
MARKKQSPAEDVTELVAMLPWWAGVVLAMVSYLVLHQMSATPKPGSLQPGQVGEFLSRSIFAMLAFYGQFIVPVLCLIGALGSFIKRRKRTNLLNQVTAGKGADVLNGMSWREFEMLVGEAFRLQGYTITELGGSQPDGGVDLVLRKGSETFLVQCKQWKAYKVSVEVVRELYGVMASRGAAGGFVITSGTFTTDAQAFVKGLNIKLVDGPKLFELIQQAKGSLKVGTSVPEGARRPQTAPAQAAPSAALLCPVCQSSMVRRTAKKGTNAGSQFWGCSKYPSCRGTR